MLACFPQVLAGTHSFFFRDYGVLGYPFIHHARESFWRGELPLWNPLSNCGVPFLAQWNTMPLYPPALIYLLLANPYPVLSSGVTSSGYYGIEYVAGVASHHLAFRKAGVPQFDERAAAALRAVAERLAEVPAALLVQCGAELHPTRGEELRPPPPVQPARSSRAQSCAW